MYCSIRKRNGRGREDRKKVRKWEEEWKAKEKWREEEGKGR